MPKSARTKRQSGVFDLAVESFVAAGKFTLDDATKPLNLLITEKHVACAKQCDESHCVIAQSITDSQVGCLAASVGESITKLLFDTGAVIRYSTPPMLKKALDRWDVIKEWTLEPGVYTLRVPSKSNRLTKNFDEDTRERKKKAWESFQQRFKRGETKNDGESDLGRTAGGGGRHRGRPVMSRQVTALTTKGRATKRGTRKPKSDKPEESTNN